MASLSITKHHHYHHHHHLLLSLLLPVLPPPPPPLLLLQFKLVQSVTWPQLHTIQTERVRKTYTNEDLLFPPSPPPPPPAHISRQNENKVAGEEEEEKEMATAFITYTAGTTGLPKGSVISHFSLLQQMKLNGAGILATTGDTNASMLSWLPL